MTLIVWLIPLSRITLFFLIVFYFYSVLCTYTFIFNISYQFKELNISFRLQTIIIFPKRMHCIYLLHFLLFPILSRDIIGSGCRVFSIKNRLISTQKCRKQAILSSSLIQLLIICGMLQAMRIFRSNWLFL